MPAVDTSSRLRGCSADDVRQPISRFGVLVRAGHDLHCAGIERGGIATLQPDSDPATLGEITPEFLTRIVNTQSGDESDRIVHFELEPSARGFGSLSIQRVRMVHSAPKTKGVSSLILKVLGTYQFHPDALPTAIDRYRTDQIREMNFYKGLLKRPLPECLHRPEPLYIIDREDTEQRWIFMEDLGAFIPGPAQSADDSLRAVTNLAALHAEWWGRTDLLDTYDWLAPVDQDATLWEGLARETMDSNFERAALHPELRHLYTDDRKALIRRLAERWIETHSQIEALPRTLIHGDFGAHNFGYRELDGIGQTILVDWDQLGVGTPGMELGRSNWLPTLLGTEHVPAGLLLDTYAASLERWLGYAVDRDAITEGYDLYFCSAGLFLLAFYALGEGPNELMIPMNRVVAGTARVLARMEEASRRWL